MYWIEECKAILAQAQDKAAGMIVAWLEAHPSDSMRGLCQEIDPDNWDALRQRTMRLQKRRSEPTPAGTTAGPKEQPTVVHKGNVRGAKSAIRRHPELARDLLADPQVREAIEDENCSTPSGMRTPAASP